MNTNHKIISTALAVLAASTAMTAAPTAADAHSPQRWDICPAADTEPACEIVRPPHHSGTAGSEVAHLPAADGTAERIDIPDYNCDEWRNPVIACPGLDGTAERIDIPDDNCAEWRNPVIACPG